MTAVERAQGLFREVFGGEPALVVRSPGRINLIGDHTDYNDGFVLPMAIDADLVIAARPRSDARVHAVSESQQAPADFELGSLTRDIGWGEYLKGVASALGPGGLVGWDGAIASDIADGAGLSSSAALELATARVFASTSGIAWDRDAMALVGHRAENDWVGMNSGIMDQLICATARAGYARLIDCRHLTGPHVAIPERAVVMLLDTATRRQLIESQYNDRRASCEAAARQLGVGHLRDATLETLETGVLSPRLLARARHVIAENQRTVSAASALAAGELRMFGGLMNQSHDSLRDDFEVSSSALDAMALAAREAPGCFGARQTGGGFAGSCVALVDAERVEAFSQATLAGYNRETGNTGKVTVCRAADGAGTIEL